MATVTVGVLTERSPIRTVTSSSQLLAQPTNTENRRIFLGFPGLPVNKNALTVAAAQALWPVRR